MDATFPPAEAIVAGQHARRGSLRAAGIAAVALALAAAAPSPAAGSDLPLLRSVRGEAAGDHFGLAIAAADVDGDGFDDLLVGARENDAGGTDAGRVYLVRGGPGAGGGFALVVTGRAAGARLGSAVAGAGDVDGDGIADFLAAADGAERVFLFRGGAPPDSTPDLVLAPESAGGAFGAALAAADVNGDGASDLLVGAPLDGSAGPQAGRVHVFLGGPGLDAQCDLHVDGRAPGDQAGCALAPAGDVDADGFDDVVIGARRAGPQHAGQALLLRGGDPPDALVDLTLSGEAADDDFGFAVASAGDVNGDGHADVLVGAPLNDAAGTMAGRAYLYWGGAPPDSLADRVLTGPSAVDELGYAVATAGDVDADGFADLLVAAPLNETGGAKAGQAYVFLGGPQLDAQPDMLFTGDTAVDELGVAVVPLARFGGADADAIALGVWLDDDAGIDAGRVDVHAQQRVGVPSARLSALAEGSAVRVRWSMAAGAVPPALRLERRSGSTAQTVVAGGALDPLAPSGEWLDVDVPPATWSYVLAADAGAGNLVLASARVTVGQLPAAGRGQLLRVLGAGPSPSSGAIDVRVWTSRSGTVRLDVLDAAGRRVAHQTLPAGDNAEIAGRWDGRDDAGRPAPSGVYWLRFRAGSAVQTRKIALVR